MSTALLTPTTTQAKSKGAAQAENVPRPISPLGGALVDAGAASFQWHGVPNATGYVVQISDDESFAGDVLELDAGTATELTLFSTLPVRASDLFWRVEATTPGGMTVQSGYGRFVAAGDDAVDAYLAEQEAKKAALAKDIAKARAAYAFEKDLIPPYERPESVTHTALLLTMSFLLFSFLLIVGFVWAIMNNAPV
ncbi:MAG: hypothetical protein AAFN13_05620 [Bacteroidota bacterium]